MVDISIDSYNGGCRNAVVFGYRTSTVIYRGQLPRVSLRRHAIVHCVRNYSRLSSAIRLSSTVWKNGRPLLCPPPVAFSSLLGRPVFPAVVFSTTLKQPVSQPRSDGSNDGSRETKRLPMFDLTGKNPAGADSTSSSSIRPLLSFAFFCPILY